MSKLINSSWQDFPPTVAGRFGTKAGRQRTMVHEGHVILVVHSPPKANELERRASIFWRHPNGTWKSTGDVKGNLSSLKGIVDAYMKQAATLEGAVETARSAADYFKILQDVAPLLRASRGLHKALQEAREALKTDVEMISLRDLAYEAERTLELVQQDANAGLDFTVARRAEEQAELGERIAKSSHRLNMITALFLPVTALGGVFGANLAHGLETTSAPWLFWGFVVVSFAVGFYVRSTVASAK